MKCARWSPVVVAVASMVFLLAGCDAKRESAESIIPKLYWGRYTGTQPSYEMRDENSNVIVFNGKTMPVPAIKNNLEIDGAGITWQQEAQEGGGGRTVSYDRGVPTTIESTKDFLLVECGFTTEGGRSNPKRRFRFDHATGGIIMLGDRGSADCVLQKY